MLMRVRVRVCVNVCVRVRVRVFMCVCVYTCVAHGALGRCVPACLPASGHRTTHTPIQLCQKVRRLRKTKPSTSAPSHVCTLSPTHPPTRRFGSSRRPRASQGTAKCCWWGLRTARWRPRRGRARWAACWAGG